MKQASCCLLMFFVIALTGGCSSNSQKILGTWHCRTENPDETTSNDTFSFSKNGRVSINSGDMDMYGSYSVSHNKLAITITEMPALSSFGMSSGVNKRLDGTIVTLSTDKLEMNTVSWEGMRRHSLCSK